MSGINLDALKRRILRELPGGTPIHVTREELLELEVHSEIEWREIVLGEPPAYHDVAFFRGRQLELDPGIGEPAVEDCTEAERETRVALSFALLRMFYLEGIARRRRVFPYAGWVDDAAIHPADAALIGWRIGDRACPYRISDAAPRRLGSPLTDARPHRHPQGRVT